MDAIYFDFSKAFDSVSHSKLIHKLKGYELADKLLTIIDNFLFNRRQRVTVCEGNSAYAPTTSGVPHGSVLGPLLFLLYTNDVVDLFSGVVNEKLYADEIK